MRNPLVKIYRDCRKGFADAEYDVRMCYWGNGSAGKVLSEGEHYSGEYKIKVIDESRKQEIIDFIKSYPWTEKFQGVAMRKIQQFHIHNILAEHFGDKEQTNLFNYGE